MQTLDEMIHELWRAVRKADKQLILAAYAKLEAINWEEHPDEFEEYNSLIDQGNDILYS